MNRERGRIRCRAAREIDKERVTTSGYIAGFGRVEEGQRRRVLPVNRGGKENEAKEETPVEERAGAEEKRETHRGNLLCFERYGGGPRNT